MSAGSADGGEKGADGRQRRRRREGPVASHEVAGAFRRCGHGRKRSERERNVNAPPELPSHAVWLRPRVRPGCRMAAGLPLLIWSQIAIQRECRKRLAWLLPRACPEILGDNAPCTACGQLSPASHEWSPHRFLGLTCEATCHNWLSIRPLLSHAELSPRPLRRRPLRVLGVPPRPGRASCSSPLVVRCACGKADACVDGRKRARLVQTLKAFEGDIRCEASRVPEEYKAVFREKVGRADLCRGKSDEEPCDFALRQSGGAAHTHGRCCLFCAPRRQLSALCGTARKAASEWQACSPR